MGTLVANIEQKALACIPTQHGEIFLSELRYFDGKKGFQDALQPKYLPLVFSEVHDDS